MVTAPSVLQCSSSSVDSPLGVLEICASPKGIVALNFPGRATSTASVVDDAAAAGILTDAAAQLRAYFEGRLTRFELPIDFRGTEFQCAAWRALCDIGFAETISYAEQARRIGRPRATRAVGAANGRNPIPVIVPCHRVVGSNGSLTGFALGTDMKRWLLDHEARTAAGAS
ncbi:MAG: methylated-DNA--[protein]-cysteine S-methyltransferase [Actinomycetota bacterium]